MSKDPKNIFLMHYSPLNTGSVAMAESAIISLKNKYPKAKITIESDYPELTEKMFTGVSVVKRAFFIADIIITKKIFSFGFIIRNIKFIIRILRVFLIGTMVGIFKIKRTPFEGLTVMINSDLILSLAGDSISQYYSYTLRFFEFWLINRYKIPNILYAQSVGPFYGLGRVQARIGLKFVTAIIARDQKTMELMKEYGIDIPKYKSVDSAIMLPTIKNNKNEGTIRKYFLNRRKAIGVVIQMNKAIEYSDNDYLQYVKGIRRLIGYLVDNKFDVIFIPTIKADYDAMVKFMQDFNIKIPMIKLFNFKASEAKGILENFYFIISSRMHPIILSSSSDGCVPVIGLGKELIGLGKEFKLIEYLKLIDHSDYFMNFLPLNEDILFGKVKEMIEKRDEIHKKIHKKMIKLKKISGNNINIVADIYSRYVE